MLRVTPQMSSTVEIRVDPADGEVYTRDEFIEVYGGVEEWDVATVIQDIEVADGEEINTDSKSLLLINIAEDTSPQSLAMDHLCSNSLNLRLAMEGTVVTASSVLLYEIFHNPLCGIVFQCGCTFNPWLGGTGWLKCNVHNASIDSPRCPWCISPRDTPQWTWTTGRVFIVTLMIVSWFVVGWKITRKQNSTTWRLVERESYKIRRRIAPVVWFLIHHALSGLIFALATGYPYWFFFTLPNSQKHSPPLLPLLPNVTSLR